MLGFVSLLAVAINERRGELVAGIKFGIKFELFLPMRSTAPIPVLIFLHGRVRTTSL
jgi:hypothetical protein